MSSADRFHDNHGKILALRLQCSTCDTYWDERPNSAIKKVEPFLYSIECQKCKTFGGVEKRRFFICTICFKHHKRKNRLPHKKFCGAAKSPTDSSTSLETSVETSVETIVEPSVEETIGSSVSDYGDGGGG